MEVIEGVEIKYKHKLKRKIIVKQKYLYGLVLLFLVIFLCFKAINQSHINPLSNNKEYRLQYFINKIYFSTELTKNEQNEFCELLFEIKGISLKNCENSDLNELYVCLKNNILEYNAIVGHSTTSNYKKTFFKAFPGLQGKVIVHHAIEQDVLNKYPNLFTKGEIHSLDNLRGIPINDNNILHLSKIRKQWNRFYRNNPNPSKQQILDKATEIDKLFGKQFKPQFQQ